MFKTCLVETLLYVDYLYWTLKIAFCRFISVKILYSCYQYSAVTLLLMIVHTDFICGLNCSEPLASPPLAAHAVSPPESEARLTCEFCGKRDYIHKFARSRRFCSVTCSKRFSAYSMRKAPDGSVTGRPTSLSKNSRSRASSAQVCKVIMVIPVHLNLHTLYC